MIERSEIEKYDFLDRCTRAGVDEFGLMNLTAKCECIDDAMGAAGFRKSKELAMYLSVVLMSYRNVRSADARYVAAAIDALDRVQDGSPSARHAERTSYFDTLIDHTNRLCPGLLDRKLQTIRRYAATR